MMNFPILRIAVPTPLYRSFDYLSPHNVEAASLQAGQRVRIPFGRRTTVGVLLEVVSHTDVAPQKLKRALELLDDAPVLDADILAMVLWASRYYHHPIGEALATALPVLLRQGHAPTAADTTAVRLTAAGQAVDPATLARAPRQAAVLAALHAQPDGIERGVLDAPAAVLRTLDSPSMQMVTRCMPSTRHSNRPLTPSSPDWAHLTPTCWKASPAAARPRSTCS
jgi:primosomal protein N' (replication factor Y)